MYIFFLYIYFKFKLGTTFNIKNTTKTGVITFKRVAPKIYRVPLLIFVLIDF